MEQEKIYNEAIDGDEGFAPGDGYPSCEGESCANVADETGGATDTMADASAAEPSAADEHAA
ncbi:MAG: nucleotide exchange factor GrpE, partial [Alistipes sp.]|nr:nucleotide exchange factor GrpE [Alistipes sp.]